MLTDQNIQTICEQLQPEFSQMLSGNLLPLIDKSTNVELLIDREVLEFFKSHSTDYQLAINNALRLFMDRCTQK